MYNLRWGGVGWGEVGWGVTLCTQSLFGLWCWSGWGWVCGRCLGSIGCVNPSSSSSSSPVSMRWLGGECSGDCAVYDSTQWSPGLFWIADRGLKNGLHLAFLGYVSGGPVLSVSCASGHLVSDCSGNKQKVVAGREASGFSHSVFQAFVHLFIITHTHTCGSRCLPRQS